jgi:preprotein translocase subunit YajC
VKGKRVTTVSGAAVKVKTVAAGTELTLSLRDVEVLVLPRVRGTGP